jgi:4'-phosphopantetheinyl transferase EntD
MAGDVSDAVAALLAPRGVQVAVRWIDPDDRRALLPAEAGLVERAVPLRQAEFATGRVLLRSLLGTQQPILRDADRRPVLPAGQVASLAHDHGLAVAAVAPSVAFVSLGIDVEPATPLDAETAGVVARPDDDPADPHLLFVLKEAAYKAWSSAGGPLLEFHDVRVRVGDGTFRAEVMATGTVLEGRWTAGLDRWFALVARPR